MGRKKPLKNVNGEGTVVYLGDKRRKPYGVRITTGTIINEKGNAIQKRRYLDYFETYKEADQFRNLYNLQKNVEHNPQLYEQFNLKKPKTKTFKELYYEWIDFKYKGQEKRIYKYAFKRLSELHDISISDITSAVIQECLNNLKTKSQATMDHNSVVLKGVFEYAISIKQIDKDYSRFCSFKGTTSAQKIHTAFTTDEIDTLWKHQEDDIARVILCLIYTGLRIDEFLSIEAENVNLIDKYIIGGSKTAAGINRTVPICGCIFPFIEDFIKEGNKYMYCYIKGRKSNDATVRTHIKDYTQKILGRTHLPHDTRYTFATLMHDAHADEVTVKKIIGHKIDDITKGVYTSISLEKMHLEISKIDYNL